MAKIDLLIEWLKSFEQPLTVSEMEKLGALEVVGVETSNAVSMMLSTAIKKGEHPQLKRTKVKRQWRAGGITANHRVFKEVAAYKVEAV